MFRIVNATAMDAAPVAAIWNPVIRDTYATFNSREKTLPEIQDTIKKQPFFLAYDGTTLVGFATYFQFRGGVGYAHTMEHTIIIAPHAHGKGLGRILLRQIESDAKSNGHHSLIGGICGINAAGIDFHIACGFKKVGYLPEVGYKNGQWLDLVLMQKLL